MLSRKIITSTIALLLATLPLLVFAGDISGPDIPKAKTIANPITKCVRDVKDMRKHHMNYLLHQRDNTLRRGIRTKQDSLSGCIACHVTPASDGNYPNIGDDKHFCSACHNYAAVSIDCFDCHNDKPVSGKSVPTGGKE